MCLKNQLMGVRLGCEEKGVHVSMKASVREVFTAMAYSVCWLW